MVLKVIDLETTGLDPVNDAIIEIASIDLKAGGTFVNAQSTLVNPGRPIPPESSAVHGIIDADVVQSPKMREVIGDYDGADAYVAHNFEMERDFLEPLIGKKVWVCTYRCAVRAWRDLPSYKNEVIRYAKGLINPLGVDRAKIVPHRAHSDILVTGAIMTELLKVANFATLVEWTNAPLYLPRFFFGMHQGTPIEQVPADYLQWVLKQKNMDPDALYTARFELERRRTKAA
ncbi:exonuclease domain-containing protein [Hyphomicrobium sp.]|uniref:exonuclease domain-containing protein n=1 Tax=Hyphomicrobium sp. TaxID=82 RepID=UPI001DCB62C1|nr:exonuclease domain-containing protein [Hyphomicrobium sp.]MBY0561442.1 hypothetical protein [Hyphomicrobium sp.]